MNVLLHVSRSMPKGRGTVFLIINFSHVAAVLKDAGTKGLPATPGSLSTGADAGGLGPTGGGCGHVYVCPRARVCVWVMVACVCAGACLCSDNKCAE